MLTTFIINLMPALKESVLTIMKITSIVAFEDSILFNVDANVPAYKADESGAMVQTEDTQFSMSYSDLARQAYPLNPDIAELRALRGQHLSGEDWIKLLTGATINVEFTFVKEGDEVARGQEIGTLLDKIPCEAEMGTHLHLEVMRGGVMQDPLAMLPER